MTFELRLEHNKEADPGAAGKGTASMKAPAQDMLGVAGNPRKWDTEPRWEVAQIGWLWKCPGLLQARASKPQ